jgi:anionic cell wall polymer biosynthesis LytR-Cps2A-Psr (LCP) family protein
MIVRIILILLAILLVIKIYPYINQTYQHFFQVKKKKKSGMRTKEKKFSSIKKDNIKDADFEDIQGGKDV